MHRIHSLRFPDGDGEEWCVEKGDIFLEEIPAFGDNLAIVRYFNSLPTLPYRSFSIRIWMIPRVSIESFRGYI